MKQRFGFTLTFDLKKKLVQGHITPSTYMLLFLLNLSQTGTRRDQILSGLRFTEEVCNDLEI